MTLPLPARGKRFRRDRKSTRLNSSHLVISYAVFCLKKNRTFAKDRSESSLCGTERGVYLFDGVADDTSRRSYLSSNTRTARIQPAVLPLSLLGTAS